ncbi:hypothetical protein J4402_00175 [Candidatus Pacearchaeota archaeon]|nr:hypothetical protein [Candidatus Pacearchaeota archaeon]
MKCPKCDEELTVKVGSKVHCEKCSVLSDMTSVATVRCEKCGHIFQIAVQSKNIFSVKKDKI